MTVRTPRVIKDDKHWLDPPEWWKQFRPLRWVAILTIVGGIGSGLWQAKQIVLPPPQHPDTAKYLAVEKSRVKLGGIFSSYDSVDSVAARLEQAGATWTQSKNHRPTDERYPPRDLDTLKIAEYLHLDQPGELTLEFFNNRLYEMYFAPKDPVAYASALHRAEPALKRDRQGRAELVQGAQRIASNVDLAASDVGRSLGTQPYALWQDTRLVKQREAWDAAFGSIPVAVPK